MCLILIGPHVIMFLSSFLIGWLLGPSHISYYDGFRSLNSGRSGRKLWYLELPISEIEFGDII